jgi:hypothetical protein
MARKLSFVLTLALVLSLGVALAQTDKQQPQMSPEQKAMMEAWQKYATPGSAHKALEPLIGKWDAKVTSWMAPGAPADVSTGVAESKWVLGNRYIQESFTGSFMGQPFHGMGYTGYDNAKKQYFGTWMDDMSTGAMTMTGSAADSKSWKFKSTMTDPMTGKDTPGESTLTVADADHHTMEMWGPAPDGKMFKMMQIDYTRKK